MGEDCTWRETTSGGRSSVVSASEFKSEAPGFDLPLGQGEGLVFFLSLRVNSCADAFVTDSPFVRTAPTQMCAHATDPIYICRKE